MEKTKKSIDKVLISMKTEAPKLWETLKKAQSHGLIFIDENHDSITATNRLLLTYPDLHEMINQIVDHWVLKGINAESAQLDYIIKQIGDDQ